MAGSEEEANRGAEVMEFMTLEEETKAQEAFAFQRGMEQELIAKLTGLSLQEVKEL